MSKNRVKIIIDDKPFTLVGEETEEHIKQVADYINVKIQEVKGLSPHYHTALKEQPPGQNNHKFPRPNIPLHLLT